MPKIRVVQVEKEGGPFELVERDLPNPGCQTPHACTFTRTSPGPDHLRLASTSDLFTPTGSTTVGVIWDLSVKKIDDHICEFTSFVHCSFTPELTDVLAKQGIPMELFRNVQRAIPEAHNRQETPFFAKRVSSVTPRGAASWSPPDHHSEERSHDYNVESIDPTAGPHHRRPVDSLR